jgi:hypothetical protein
VVTQILMKDGFGLLPLEPRPVRTPGSLFSKAFWEKECYTYL